MNLSTGTLQRHLGVRLREIRLRRGLSQRDLAEPRYDGSYVSQIEAGRRAPSGDALLYFARKLKIAAEELSAAVPPSVVVELDLLRKSAADAFDAGDSARARELYERLLSEAQGCASVDFQADALLGVGLIHEASGEVAAALDSYRAAEELEPAEETLIRARIALGRAYRTAGDLSYSVDLMERVLDHARKSGWAEHSVRAAVQLAGTLAERGDHRRARQVLESVRPEAELIRDPRALATLHWARAHNAAGLGNAEDALKHIARARGLYELENATLELARLEGSRAFHLIELGRPEEAAPILAESVDTLSRAGATLEAARLQTEQARAELAQGRSEHAAAIGERALETLRGLQDPIEEATCAIVLALALGQTPRAEALLKMSAEIFARHGAREEEARALQALGDFYLAAGRGEEALTAFREALGKVVAPVVSRP